MKTSLHLFAILACAITSAAAQIKLVSPTPSADANFGFRVLVADGIVYVGAPGAAAGGTQRGEVLAYDAATGAYRGRVRDFFATDYARFGESMAIVGNRLFIGSPLRAGPSYGRVYYSSLPILGDRLSTQYISAPDAASNENFGAAIAVFFGNGLLVGSPDGPAGQGVGKIYSFLALENPPTLDAGPLTLDSVAGARLGAAIAGSDQAFVVGSPLHPFTGTQSGRLYIGRAGGSGTTYAPPGLPAGSELGDSVAAFGTRILAGAPNFEPSPDQNNLGAAYLIDSAGPTVVRQFLPDEIGGRFGESVALSARLAAVGASYSSAISAEGGAFYLFPTKFKARDNPVIFPIAPRGLGERDRFGAAMSMDASHVAVGAPEQDPNGIDDAGAVYVYALAAPRPVVKPRPKSVIATGPRVKIAGVARRGFHAIARVEYALERNGAYKPVRGTKRWQGKAKIGISTRKIFVRALDAAGTASKSVPIRVSHALP